MFHVLALQGCPYSQQAVDTLTRLTKGNPDLRLEIQWVKAEEKSRYQTRDRPTFPQITYRYKDNVYYVGGNDRLQELLQLGSALKARYGKPVLLPLLHLMNSDLK